MGAGRYDVGVYNATMSSLRAAGKSSFSYSDDHLARIPRNQWTVHPDLDVKGVNVRESRDSAEHPTSVAIGVIFDVTGSMRGIPRALQAKLPDLHGHLQQADALEHPQLLFGAIGDAQDGDRVPLQMGQFESDNRMDDQLGKIVLEGGGGAGGYESYDLALYFFARHTSIDCFERRGEKGYLFLIGDELARKAVKGVEVAALIDDGLQGEVPLDVILDEVKQKYELFFILPEGTAHAQDTGVADFWKSKVGDANFLRLSSVDDICDVIGTAIQQHRLLPSLKAMVNP